MIKIEALKFLNELNRMCEYHKFCYPDCILGKAKKDDCREWIIDHPKEAIKKIEEWSKNNPEKTLLDLVKNIPGLKKEENIPDCCIGNLFDISIPKKSPCLINNKCNCKECWNLPVSVLKNE